MYSDLCATPPCQVTCGGVVLSVVPGTTALCHLNQAQPREQLYTIVKHLLFLWHLQFIVVGGTKERVDDWNAIKVLEALKTFHPANLPPFGIVLLLPKVR